MSKPEKYKITYLFGAGASIGKSKEWIDICNSYSVQQNGLFQRDMGKLMFGMPITEQLDKIRLIFSRWNDIISSQGGDEYSAVRRFFFNERLGHPFTSQLSPDTFGRVLLVKGDTKAYHKYKLELSLFFSLMESMSLPDVRYGHLIANFIELETGKLPESINFLSYNYDSNLERAFEQFMGKTEPCENYFVRVRNHFQFVTSEYDDYQTHLSKVVKLNGTAAMVNRIDGSTVVERPLIDYPTLKLSLNAVPVPLPSLPGEPYLLKDSQRLFHKMNQMVKIFKEINNSPESYIPNLCFSWDTNENNTVLKAGMDVMKETDILVVVGYSFPAFNLSNDIKLLKAFVAKGGTKVYIQLPNGSAQEAEGRVKQIVASMDSKVVVRTIENCGQFYIPSEYFESKSVESGPFGAFGYEDGTIEFLE